MPAFIVDEFIDENIFIANNEGQECEYDMPKLFCPECNGKMAYKETDE